MQIGHLVELDGKGHTRVETLAQFDPIKSPPSLPIFSRQEVGMHPTAKKKKRFKRKHVGINLLTEKRQKKWERLTVLVGLRR